MPYRRAELQVPAGPPRRSWRWLVALPLLGGAAWIASRYRPPVEAPYVPVIPPLRVTGRPWVTMFLPEDRQFVVRDSDRFTASPAAVVAAAERFASPISAAVAVEAGWVFITNDGSLYRADSYLGTPRPLGRHPCAFHVPFHTRGRAVLVDAIGGLWTTDGDRPLSRAVLPGRALHAAFQDRLHGVAVTDDGRLLVTADGGQRWTASGLGPDVAWAASLLGDGILVETTAGGQLVRWNRDVATLTPDASRYGRWSFVAEIEGRLAASARSVRELPPVPARSRCGWSVAQPAPYDRSPQRRYACDVSALAARRPVGNELQDSGALVSARSGGTRFQTWRDEREGFWLRAAWRGFDEAGEYAATTAASDLGLDRVAGGMKQEPRVQLVAASRGGALVMVEGVDGDSNYAESLAWARPDGAFRAVASVRARSGFRSASMTTADGGVLFLQGVMYESPIAWEQCSVGFSRPEFAVGMSWRLDASGAIVARRGFLFAEYWRWGFAAGRVGDAVGAVVRAPGDDRRQWLLPVDGSAAIALPAFRWTETAACDRVDPGAALVDVRDAPVELLAERPVRTVDSAGHSVGAEIEVRESGSCIRTLSALSAYRAGVPQPTFFTVTGVAGDRFDGDAPCRPLPPDARR